MTFSLVSARGRPGPTSPCRSPCVRPVFFCFMPARLVDWALAGQAPRFRPGSGRRSPASRGLTTVFLLAPVSARGAHGMPRHHAGSGRFRSGLFYGHDLPFCLAQRCARACACFCVVGLRSGVLAWKMSQKGARAAAMPERPSFPHRSGLQLHPERPKSDGSHRRRQRGCQRCWRAIATSCGWQGLSCHVP